jgi:hypothetical protein
VNVSRGLEQRAEVGQRLHAQAVGVRAEQRLGVPQPALGAQPPQPAPQHQVGEDEVARSRHALPQRGADRRSEHGQQHPERHRQRNQGQTASRHEHPDHDRREQHDERGRHDGMRQPALRPGRDLGRDGTAEGHRH